jgi:hypothetical protein
MMEKLKTAFRVLLTRPSRERFPWAGPVAQGPESEKKQQIYIRLIETASIPLGPFRWEAGISRIF